MSRKETKAAPSANRTSRQTGTSLGPPSLAELVELREPLNDLARRSVSGRAPLSSSRPINLERRARFGRFGFGV